MEDNQDTRILAKLERIRDWLRMHRDYDVIINLQGWYGCRIGGTYGGYNLTLSQFGRTIKFFTGLSLSQQLDEMVSFLEEVA